LARAI
jgi:ABC-type multidrug transport system ATPase subunit